MCLAAPCYEPRQHLIYLFKIAMKNAKELLTMFDDMFYSNTDDTRFNDRHYKDVTDTYMMRYKLTEEALDGVRRGAEFESGTFSVIDNVLERLDYNIFEATQMRAGPDAWFENTLWGECDEEGRIVEE